MAYDGSKVEMKSGGFGYDSALCSTTIATGITVIDPSYPLVVPVDGNNILKRVLVRMANYGQDTTSMKIKVFRPGTVESEAGFVLVGDVDVTDQYNTQQPNAGAGLDADVSSANISVQNGDLIGIFCFDEPSGADARIQRYSNVSTVAATDNLYSIAGDLTVDVKTSDLTSLGILPAMNYSAFIESASYVYEDDSVSVSSGGTEIMVPTYTELADTYYYLLEDVQVADEEALQVDFYTVANSTDSMLGQLKLDFVGANKFISFAPTTAGWTLDTPVSNDLTDIRGGDQSGDIFDIYLKVNFVSSSFVEWDILYVNKSQGQNGTDNDFQVKYISINDCASANVNNFKNTINRIVLTSSQTPTVGAIKTMRKPILPLSDSYVSGGSGGINDLIYVGAKLPTAFSELRHVVPSGIAGSQVYTDNYTTNIELRNRWLGALQCFEGTVVVQVNGPSVNDLFNKVTAEDAESKNTVAGGIASQLGQIAKDTARDNSDLVFCEMIPPIEAAQGVNLEPQQECAGLLNDLLAQYSITYNRPIAGISDYFANGYDFVDEVHPTEEGAEWIAGQIASAYESNAIAEPSSGTAGRGYRTRYA